MRKTSVCLSVCLFVTEVCLWTITVTLCQDYHPRPPRPREIEAELRASSLAGFDWRLKTPSPLSSLTSHTQSSHRVRSPQLSLCSTVIGCPRPMPASHWSLASTRGLDSGPSLHWSHSATARCTGGRPGNFYLHQNCLLYTSPSPRDGLLSRMPSSA